MNRLAKRLEKLEAMVAARAGWVSGEEINKIALSKLSAGDREVVEQAIARHDGCWFMDTYPAVWERWDDALGAAMSETGFPIRIRAVDWEL